MTTQEEIDERTVSDALSIIQRDYWNVVRGIEADLRDAVKNGEVSDVEEAETWLHETVDGHQYVIYTHLNFRVLQFSNNRDALSDELGAEELLRDGNVNWAGMAYMALMADVRDRLGDLDDLFNETEWE
jgi:hypothetical protein